MQESIITIIVFFFGAIIGSFLNVVILRYRSGRTLGGRSMCFSCGKTLAWTELVPIGSYLTQRGKCAGCRTPISWQYPAVEIATGVVFTFLFFHFKFLFFTTPLLFAILFIYYGFIFCLLTVLSVYDLKHKILPDPLSLLFAIVSFIGAWCISGNELVLHIPTVWNLLAGILIPLPFVVLWYASKGRLMGLGDPKLMVGIGFLLGMSQGVTAVLISFWIGAIVGVLMLIFGSLFSKKSVSMKTAIPFGPFLVLGTMITFFAGLDFSNIIGMFGTF